MRVMSLASAAAFASARAAARGEEEPVGAPLVVCANAGNAIEGGQK